MMINDWNIIKGKFQNSPNRIEIVTIANSPDGNTLLDTVVNNASVIIVNGYLRVLCSGDSDFENIFKFNNKFKHIIGENKYALAHDVFGGIFALTSNGIYYFSPDTLQWEDLEISYDGFMEWISTNDINEFYSSFIWDGFNEYVHNFHNDNGILIYPFLWSKECDVTTSSKKIVPLNELLETNYEFTEGLNGE